MMAYPDYLVQRAIELSSGRSAGEVLKVLTKEFPEDDMPDARTIRRWRKTSVNHSVTNKEHLEQLIDIVNILLADDLDSTMYKGDVIVSDEKKEAQYIITDRNGTEELSKDDISAELEYNTESACRKYSDWFFYSCFLIHIVNDSPEEYKAKNYWEFLREQPYKLIETLRLLAERKTFKGTCPVCKEWQ
ncbi:hypothetical protein ACFLTT_01315 [Chloroflexota bacterium]